MRDYASSGVRVQPIVTAGVGVEWNGSKGPFDFKAESALQANLSPGTSLSSLRASAGGAVSLRGVATLEAHVTAAQTIARGAAVAFVQPQGSRVGGEAKLQLDVFEKVKPFVSVQRGGVMNDTTYTVGISVGEGSLPWLNPRR